MVPEPGTLALLGLGLAGAITLVQRIAERLGRMLEKRGLIERDAESAWLSADPEQSAALDELIGHSITYRIRDGATMPRTCYKQGEWGGTPAARPTWRGRRWPTFC